MSSLEHEWLSKFAFPPFSSRGRTSPTITSSRVSLETDRHIALLFPPEERDWSEYGNDLPFLDKLDDVQLERFRFAVLKLGQTSLTKLDRAAAFVKQDWRGLLIAAGLAEDPSA
jgi:hypothetical protein